MTRKIFLILISGIILISFILDAKADPFIFPKIISKTDGLSNVPSIAVSGSNVFVAWQEDINGNKEIMFAKSADSGATFNEPVNISNKFGYSSTPSIAVSSNNVYVTWSQSTSGGNEILFVRSDNSGANFTTPININNDPGSTYFPSISASGSNVYVIWIGYHFDTFGVTFSKSTDSGENFSPPVKISNIGITSVPSISSSDENVYVTWWDYKLGNNEVMFSKSNDSGSTFDLPINISNTITNSVKQSISSVNSNVYVAWIESSYREIMFAKSTDFGKTFGTPVQVTHGFGEKFAPTIFGFGNNVYLVWNEIYLGNSEVMITKSGDQGDMFSIPENISRDAIGSFSPSISASESNVYISWSDKTPGNEEILVAKTSVTQNIINISNSPGISREPSLSTYGFNVFVAWQDNTFGPSEILFSKSTDSGISFDTPINISNNTGFSYQPSTSSSDSNVFVTWRDDTPGNGEILFSSSFDSGVTFTEPINISNTSGLSNDPSVSAFGSNVYVTWRDFTLGPPEILFSKSTDSGISFDTPINISNNSGYSSAPSIKVFGSDVFIAWTDNIPGNNEIMFSKSTDSGSSFSLPINISNTFTNSIHPDISISGSNVFVTWREESSTNEIFFARSTDSGTTFSIPINLSNTFSISAFPSIGVSGSNIFVTWGDDALGNYEIMVAKSTDSGMSFDTPNNISSNFSYSNFPSISISGFNVFVTWEDSTPRANILFSKILPSLCWPTENNWVITSSCILSNSFVATGDITIKNGAVLIIPDGVELDINLEQYYLIIEPGSGMIIEDGGAIK